MTIADPNTLLDPSIEAIQQPMEPMEPDAEDIQAGEEEADEGLWLLWNNDSKSSSSTPDTRARARAEAGSSARLLRPNPTTYGSSLTADPLSSSDDEDNEEDEREERLERAKAQAKHVDDYTAKGSHRSRSCCTCII